MTTTGALPQSRYFTLERIGDGAYAAIAIAGQGAMGNAGVVDLGGATLVFDTMLSLAAARDLRSVAEQLTRQRVRYAINSHHHPWAPLPFPEDSSVPGAAEGEAEGALLCVGGAEFGLGTEEVGAGCELVGAVGWED